MTELKTLKDMDIIDMPDRKGFCEQVVNIEELKQEAIKHIKEWQSDERLSYPTATIDINAPLALIQLELEIKIRIFKCFFNIVDEELK